MLLHTFRSVPALAVTGLLLLAGGSDSGARSPGPVSSLPTTSSTTTVPVTSTVAPATSTTVATTRPPATTAGPQLVEGIPQVIPTPARATVGQRVRIEETGFTDSMWRSADAPL